MEQMSVVVVFPRNSEAVVPDPKTPADHAAVPGLPVSTPAAETADDAVDVEEGAYLRNSTAAIQSMKKKKQDRVMMTRPVPMIHKAAAEFLGTYMLILVGCGAGFISQRGKITVVGVAAGWGAATIALKYSIGHISGAHLNPAVSIAFAITLNFPKTQVLVYVAMQIAGAVVACAALRWLFIDDDPQIMVTLPGDATTDAHVIVWETLITFNLVFISRGSGADKHAAWSFHGIASGAVYFFNILITGRVAGASMNPARSIGPAVATRNYHKLWIYIFAPVGGATLASAVFNLLLQPSSEEEDDDDDGENATKKTTTTKVFEKLKSLLISITTTTTSRQSQEHDEDEGNITRKIKRAFKGVGIGGDPKQTGQRTGGTNAGDGEGTLQKFRRIIEVKQKTFLIPQRFRFSQMPT